MLLMILTKLMKVQSARLHSVATTRISKAPKRGYALKFDVDGHHPLAYVLVTL